MVFLENLNFNKPIIAEQKKRTQKTSRKIAELKIRMQLHKKIDRFVRNLPETIYVSKSHVKSEFVCQFCVQISMI